MITLPPGATNGDLPSPCGSDAYYCTGDGTRQSVPLGHKSTGPSPELRTDISLCGDGEYCSKGRATPCPLNTYTDYTGSSNPEDRAGLSACNPCSAVRAQAVTEGVGSSSASECICPPPKVPDDGGGCVCPAGFEGDDGGCQKCAPGFRKSVRGDWACEPCFRGADCGQSGTSYPLEALPLDDGWWRLSPSSTVAYRCPLNGTCPGAAERASIEGLGCRAGHTGPLCAACESNWSWFNGVCEPCVASTETRSFAILISFLVLVATAAIAAAVFARFRRAIRIKTAKQEVEAAEEEAETVGRRKEGEAEEGEAEEGAAEEGETEARNAKRTSRRMSASKQLVREKAALAAKTAKAARNAFQQSLQMKMFLTVAFMQMLGVFGLSFQVDWPEEYDVVVREVNAVMNLNAIGPVAAACIFPGFRWTWHYTLLVQSAGRTFVVAMLQAVAFVLKRRRLRAVAAVAPDEGRTTRVGAVLRNAAPLNAVADTVADTQLVLASSILNAVSGYNLDEGLSKLANFLTFFFYPSLCVMLFTTFVQRRFVGGADANVTTGEYFLAADLSIPYYGETHSLFQVYALFMIALWPVGVPVYMMRVLFRNREGVTALARAQVRYEDKLELALESIARGKVDGQKVVKAAFQKWDTDSNGRVSRTEFDRAVEVLELDPAEVTAAWERLDHDGSGSVEEKELEKDVRALKEHATLKAEVKERETLKAEYIEDLKAAEALLKDKDWIKARLGQYEARVFYFDVIECLRKLSVAGLSAFFPPGSFEKLVFGVLVTCFFLAVTARLSPYQHKTDDVLAVIYQSALLLTLTLAVLLKGAATDGRSAEEFAQFELQVGRALLTFCIAPIVCGGLLAVLDLVATRRYSRKMESMFSEAYNQGYFDEGFVGLGFGMDASAWGDGGIDQGDL